MDRLQQGRIRYLGTLLGLALLAACGSQAPTIQHLDPLTGVTITRATKPIVLYRDQSAQAAFARDYVYMGPIQVNNMGERQYYLWLGIWGTSDNRSAELDAFESIVLYADGEPMVLDVKGWTLGAVSASEPIYVKPVASASDAFYSVTIDQVRRIAESRDIELRAGSSRPQRYIPWESSGATTAELAAFLRNVDR